MAKIPTIKDIHTFGKQWWSWWGTIQPKLHEHNSADLLVIDGHGDWDVLKKPGKNGLHIVLLLLAWWGLLAADTLCNGYDIRDHKHWNDVVKDVAWVITQMVDWAGNEWCVPCPCTLSQYLCTAIHRKRYLLEEPEDSPQLEKCCHC